MIPRFRAKLLGISGEPHDIILHTKTASAEIDVIITPDMLDLIAEQILAVRKKIKEPA